MSDNLKVLQVFIASPSDLADERRAIKEVADDLNAAFGKTVGLQVQLLGWEDRLPGFGRAQAQINEDVDKADLFVGFLWRRWGSDPGNPKYDSGFEEEFNRAIERRERDGSPEISLFFKEVTITSPGDIDDQLKHVLEFREKVASKKLLFAQFTTIEDWKKKARDLLHGHLLMLLKPLMGAQSKGQPQAPPADSSQESSKDATGQKGKTSSSTAKQQVIRVWAEALDAIKQGELSKFGTTGALQKLQIARLGLAAASMTNRDIEADLPAVHLTNLLFKSRKQLELTQLEWFLILRANLVATGGYRPGWYWLRRTSLNLKGALTYFACQDDHQAVRTTALGYATKLTLPLLRKNRKGHAPIETLCSHAEADARKAGLEYLADNGTTKDLALVERLRSDSDSDVRAQADVTRNDILLRGDPSQFFEKSILANPWVSEDGIRTLQKHASRIAGESLKKALTHPDTKVVVFAAKELVARDLVTL